MNPNVNPPLITLNQEFATSNQQYKEAPNIQIATDNSPTTRDHNNFLDPTLILITIIYLSDISFQPTGITLEWIHTKLCSSVKTSVDDYLFCATSDAMQLFYSTQSGE